MSALGRNIAAALLSVFSSLAVAQPADELEARILAVCLNTANAAAVIIRHLEKGGVPVPSSQLKDLALELSDPLPQSYNAVNVGLTSASEVLDGASHTQAILEVRAAVIGMWCINDIVSSVDPSGAPILQDAETQQSLIDQIALLINQQQLEQGHRLFNGN